MRGITAEDLNSLLAPGGGPCVSIYQPVERAHPMSLQGPVQYKNLLSRAEQALREKHPAAQVKGLMDRFRSLLEDTRTWGDCRGGLAVLGSPDEFHVFDVPRPVPEMVAVANTYHVKPLLRVVQSADRFQVLCLSRGRARLLEGNRDGLREAPLRGIPATAEEAEARRQGHPGRKPGGAADASMAAHVKDLPGSPTHTTRDDNRKDGAGLYFQAVARVLRENVSNPTGLPLVLAALPENQAMFRAHAHNQHLLPAGVEHDPWALSDDDLRRQAWRCVEPLYLDRLARLSDDFRTAQARGQGTGDLADAARAAFEGRVYSLLVEADRLVPGTIDDRGVFTPGGDETTEDALDDLAELVLRRKGNVVVVPRERMPTATGLAATLRY